MEAWLTQLFERHRGRYVTGACAFVLLETIFLIGPTVALFPSHYEGLSIGQYLIVVGAADVAALLLFSGAAFVQRRELRALIAWADLPNERDHADAQRIAFDGPRRAVLFICVFGLPLGAGLVVLLALLRNHTTALDWLELAIGAGSSIGLSGVAEWFTLEVLLRPLKVALAPPPSGTRRANLPVRLALVIPATICMSAFALGYLTTTRDKAGSEHLMVVYAIALACTAFCLLLIVPLFIAAVVTPLRELARATRDVAAGRFGTRVPVAATDELGQLAQSFNHMLDELEAARARIVTSGDTARRRVERDIHDGAQQQLVLVGLKLGMLQRLLGDHPKAEAIASELRSDVDRALRELRELAQGLYPTQLEADGLPGALREAATRAAIPTTVACDGAGRYRPELEAAVYFCCLEALQNVAKHAGNGAHASVSIVERSGALEFEIADDGAGFDRAANPGGAGVQNMADRIGAVHGEVRIESSPGGGTTVSGRVPVVGA